MSAELHAARSKVSSHTPLHVPSGAGVDLLTHPLIKDQFTISQFVGRLSQHTLPRLDDALSTVAKRWKVAFSEPERLILREFLDLMTHAEPFYGSMFVTRLRGENLAVRVLKQSLRVSQFLEEHNILNDMDERQRKTVLTSILLRHSYKGLVGCIVALDDNFEMREIVHAEAKGCRNKLFHIMLRKLINRALVSAGAKKPIDAIVGDRYGKSSIEILRSFRTAVPRLMRAGTQQLALDLEEAFKLFGGYRNIFEEPTSGIKGQYLGTTIKVLCDLDTLQQYLIQTVAVSPEAKSIEEKVQPSFLCAQLKAHHDVLGANFDNNDPSVSVRDTPSYFVNQHLGHLLRYLPCLKVLFALGNTVERSVSCALTEEICSTIGEYVLRGPPRVDSRVKSLDTWNQAVHARCGVKFWNPTTTLSDRRNLVEEAGGAFRLSIPRVHLALARIPGTFIVQRDPLATFFKNAAKNPAALLIHSNERETLFVDRPIDGELFKAVMR